MYLGKRSYLNGSICVAEKYGKIAEEDKNAAILLLEKDLYNQAAYFLIQAMEKQIKSKIAGKIDITNPYVAGEISKTMGHSLESSVLFLIEIYTGNHVALKQQMEKQLVQQVLKEINFKALHNSVRYPLYHMKYHNYTSLDICKEECQELVRMYDRLKNYLSELDKRYV